MNIRPPALVLAATLAALLCGFFVFYTVRLLFVTRFLTEVRTGGSGAFVGAIVFPVLAIGSGFLAFCCVKAAWSSWQ